MQLEIQHVEIHVSSLEKAKEFYEHVLGLEVLEEITALNLISLKAGSIRISIFGGHEPRHNSSTKETGTHLIFRTNNLKETIETLKSRGVIFMGDVFEALGFLKGIATQDPDGNTIEIAEYLRDPLKRN